MALCACGCGCGREFDQNHPRQRYFSQDCQYQHKLEIQKTRYTPRNELLADDAISVLTDGEIEQRDIKQAIDVRYLGEVDLGKQIKGKEFNRLRELYEKRENGGLRQHII